MEITNKTIVYILLVVMIFALIFALFALKDGYQCVQNPLKYAAKDLSKTEAGDISCNCYFSDPMYKGFSFNKENLTFFK